jgi:hypothetical protein
MIINITVRENNNGEITGIDYCDNLFSRDGYINMIDGKVKLFLPKDKDDFFSECYELEIEDEDYSKLEALYNESLPYEKERQAKLVLDEDFFSWECINIKY